MYKLNKDNTILLLAFLVIIGALISSSIESITGKVISKKITKMSVSPSLISPDKEVYVTVNPGEEGVNEDAVLFDSEGVNLGSEKLCAGSYKCTEPVTFSFKIPENWKSGVYQVKVYDYGIKDYIKGDFTIKGGIING